LDFLRVVEVFPPLVQGRQGKIRDLETVSRSFVEDVSRIKDCADLVLVASLKDPKLMAVPSTIAASILVGQAGADAAPVIVARDSDRRTMASNILGAYSLGLRTLMLVWGDKQVGGAPTRARDFTGLSQVLVHATKISQAAGVKCRLLAPVDLDRLSTQAGFDLAKSRLESGASLLLAQPPTTDSNETLDSHLALLDSCGLRDRVLLSIFPFRDRYDVARSETYFGWKLPSSLKGRAAAADYSPIDEARSLAKRIRKEGMPGLYLSTRGTPEIARRVLG
jgi:5,10-methylenetetrahydrofolate reductase